jgi:hypothetical protein
VTQQYEEVMGMDWTMPAAPPLTQPQVSILSEARTLINLEGLVARRQALVEKMASAAEQLEAFDMGGVVGDDDQPGEADSVEDARKALEQQMSEWQGEMGSLVSTLAEQQRFEHGFVFLPELDDTSTITFTEDEFPAISNPTQGALKPVGPNQALFLWYDPFLAVGLDSRSAFGWPNTDMASRVARCVRALLSYEATQAAYEFWTGTKVPTNLHLSASPNSSLTSPHRTLRYAFDDPTAPGGTVLGVPVSLSDSLAKLDQTIADTSSGTGMIHCTPYVAQKWMEVYPYVRDSSGDIRTVNSNVIVPSYGYPGTGPDQASRSVADAVTNSTTELTSATADFTLFDVGNPVEGAGIPAGTVIASWVSATEVEMSQAATASASGVTITLPGVGGSSTGLVLQWAYATDFVYHLQGDVHTYPLDLREMSPDLPVDNLVEVRAERSHALITNNLLRAAVLVDTSTL